MKLSFIVKGATVKNPNNFDPNCKLRSCRVSAELEHAKLAQVCVSKIEGEIARKRS